MPAGADRRRDRDGRDPGESVSAMMDPGDQISAEANWPIRLADAFERLHATHDPEEYRDARETLWTILYFGLRRCLRAVAPRLGMAGVPEIDDIASTKSLEMLARAESGMMDLSGKSAVDVVAFLSSAARHGLLDLKRLQARSVVMRGDAERERSHGEEAFWPASQAARSPSAAVEVRDFAHALRSCLGKMPVRSRRIWFLRAVLGLSSREIAGHPEVSLTSPHVDVLMQRIRVDLKACMEAMGHARTDLPPGTFAELWDYFRDWDSQVKPAAHEGAASATEYACGQHPSRTAMDDGSEHES